MRKVCKRKKERKNSQLWVHNFSRISGSLCLLLLSYCGPSFAFFNHDRAVLAAQRGDWAQAEQHMQPLLVDNADNARVMYDAGVANFKIGQYEQAAACFEQSCACECVPLAVREQAFFNAGNAYIKLNNPGQAVRCYESCLHNNSKNSYAQHNLEKARELLKKQEEQNRQKNKSQEKEKEKGDQADKQQGDQDQKDQNGQQPNKNDKGDGQQDAHDASGHQGGDEQKQQDVNHDTASEKNSSHPQDTQEKQSGQDQNAEKADQKTDPKDNKKNGQQHSQDKSQESGDKPDASPGTGNKNKAGSEQDNSAGASQGVEPGADQGAQETWLAQLLQEQDSADQKANKKLMKAMMQQSKTGSQGGHHGQNSW